MKLGQWIGFLALVASIYIVWEIRQVLLLVFAAVVLANSLNLLARRLQKTGIRRGGAVLLAVLAFVGALAGFAWLIVPPFAAQFQELIVLFPEGANQVDRWLDQAINLVPEQFSSYVPDLNSLGQQLAPHANRLLGGSFAFFSNSLGVVVNVLLVVVLGIMLLVNPVAYRRGFIRLFPAFYRRRVDQILMECEAALGGWIGGALISMTVVAILSTMGLALLGVRAALAQGVLAGLLNFIPNIGPTLSVVLPMSIALLDGPLKSLLVLVLYIGIQQFESNFLTPYIMAQQVSLLPAVTLMAQVFFATIFGFLGLALALPLTVVSQIWIRRALVEDVLDRWSSPHHMKAFNSGPTEPYPAETLSETVIYPTEANHQTTGTEVKTEAEAGDEPS